jgi:hypothetical protein
MPAGFGTPIVLHVRLATVIKELKKGPGFPLGQSCRFDNRLPWDGSALKKGLPIGCRFWMAAIEHWSLSAIG